MERFVYSDEYFRVRVRALCAELCVARHVILTLHFHQFVWRLTSPGFVSSNADGEPATSAADVTAAAQLLWRFITSCVVVDPRRVLSAVLTCACAVWSHDHAMLSRRCVSLHFCSNLTSLSHVDCAVGEPVSSPADVIAVARWRQSGRTRVRAGGALARVASGERQRRARARRAAVGLPDRVCARADHGAARCGERGDNDVERDFARVNNAQALAVVAQTEAPVYGRDESDETNAIADGTNGTVVRRAAARRRRQASPSANRCVMHVVCDTRMTGCACVWMFVAPIVAV
jgi:hypothetical protein